MTLDQRQSLKMIHDDISYRNHQLEGIRLMAKMGSFILADDMGLGKSLQALTVAAIDFQRLSASKVLIVSPATLKWNWLDEIEKFTNFQAVILDGTPAGRKKQLAAFEVDVLIVNYEQVMGHLDELNAMNFDIVIFDEAHYIKNPKAKRTKAIHALRGKRFFLLTGSPLLNRVDELWSLLHKVDPVKFPKYWPFLHRYAVYGGYGGQQILPLVNNEPELKEKLRNLMIRREKKDVLDLPAKQYITVKVPLHAEQRKLYQQAVEELKIDLPDDPNGMELENEMVKFLRLKQICGTTATIPGHKDYSLKLDRAVEMIDEMTANGHHVVVFTQFRVVQACLVERLESVGKRKPVPCSLLHGDVPPKDRVGVVKAWAGMEPGAMVAMLQVAGVGLNMTKASKCIFLDKLFVPKLNEQAEDRIHRIGASSTQPVQIYHLMATPTIESRIEAIIRSKQKLFDGLINESEWKRKLFESLKEDDE